MDEPLHEAETFLAKLREAVAARRDAVAAGKGVRAPVDVGTWEALSSILAEMQLDTRAVWVGSTGAAQAVDVAALKGALPHPRDVVAAADVTWVLAVTSDGAHVSDLR